VGSPSDAAFAAADAALTAIFGEPVLISPRVVAPRRGQAADAAREAKTVTGIFTLMGDEESLEGATRGGRGRGTTSVAVADATCWLSKASIASLGFTPRTGDALVFSDRGNERWTVVRPDPSDIGDVTLHIVRERDAVELT
jgi:hypothetical protein